MGPVASKAKMASGGVAAGSEAAVMAQAQQREYPDFKEYFVAKPQDCLAFRKNTVEQNFYILQRNKGQSRTTTCRAMCAFCAHSFQCMSITKIRVHLPGEAEGDCRVEPCSKVPAACRDFYQKERNDNATSARQKRSLQIERIKELA